MSRNTPRTGTSLEADDKSPKEGWFKRHRNAIVLTLGIGVACACCRKPNQQPTPTEEQRTKSPASATTTSKKPKLQEMDVMKMPSPCDLKRGTFLADNNEFSQFCEGGPIKEGESCKSVDEWKKASLIQRMKMGAIMGLIRTGLAERGKNNAGDLLEADVVENFQDFNTLPESYRAALKEFDPALYESLKDRVYIEKMGSLEKDMLGTAANAKGPLSIEENRLIPSPSGQYHVVSIGELSDINIKEALQKNDRASIAEFLQNSATLAHEIYGHIFLSNKRLIDTYGTRFLKFDEMCSKGTPEKVKDELYAYFMEAKMIAFMAERYPKIRKILQETYANRENFKAQMEQKVVCSHEEAADFLLDEDATDQTLFRLAKSYKAYQKAKKTGDWKPFKDSILANNLILQFGLPYFIHYLKTHGRADCASTLNRKIEAMRSKDSPEKLFETK